MKRIAALLLLSCSTGSQTDCADPAPCAADLEWEYVCIDTALPQDPTRLGIREWGGMLCDRRRFAILPFDGAGEIPAQCRYTLLYADPAWPWVRTDAAGFAEIDRGIAWIVVDRVPPDLMRYAVEHEFGHLLGIRADGGGIMADPLAAVCITSENVAAVNAALEQ